VEHLQWHSNKSEPYAVYGDEKLIAHLSNGTFAQKGVTATNVGFYGPQGRVLRLSLPDKMINKKISSFSFNKKKITNLEMETAGIYGMSKLLGHRAVSMNAILANRSTGEFSKNSEETINTLIKYTLDKIVQHSQ